MGHAGAIIAGGKGTAAEKMKVMKECGIYVVESPADIGKTIKIALEKVIAGKKEKSKKKLIKKTKKEAKKENKKVKKAIKKAAGKAVRKNVKRKK
jgi:predicted Rossmann-fold nucleotide-binding protein